MSRIYTFGLQSLSRFKPKGNLIQCRPSSGAVNSAFSENVVGNNPRPNASSEVSFLEVDISYPAFMIWGANTGVGKTVVSTGLAASILSNKRKSSKTGARHNVDGTTTRFFEEDVNKDVRYIKPLQTGYPNDSDAGFVTRHVSDFLLKEQKQQQESENRVYISNQTLQVSPIVQRALNFSKDAGTMKHLETSDEREVVPRTAGRRSNAADSVSLPSHLTCTTLWAWFDPVSPHLAAHKESASVEDSSIVHTLVASLNSLASSHSLKAQRDPAREGKGETKKWAIIETAGGVSSPGPSGALQCDIYRPLRLPGVLVGDGRLGGITSTVSAFESLQLRGYDVEAVILIDAGLGNDVAIRRYLQGRVPVFVLPPLSTNREEDLGEWYAQSTEIYSQLQFSLEESHSRRIQRLRGMPYKAQEILWWPFTQHTMVPLGDVTTIDSRCGDSFIVHKSTGSNTADALEQQLDGCASWWTQGPDLHLQQEIARDVGYAAARYGHVLFPENVNEPALRCAELLLQGAGKGWAKRVFYSDNGSTAIEIALKMAFRKFVADHGILKGSGEALSPVESQVQLKVLALRGSYHGDTLGAMEAQAPSAYTGFRQQPWYSGRGLYLDPPTVSLQQGRWLLQLPASFGSTEPSEDVDFKTREDVFDSGRNDTAVANVYLKRIKQQLSNLQAKGETFIGALIMETVIHAAGGMEMIDPLFQRILVQECQLQKIPVIFDEVFAGIWRLGVESAAELLECKPDIACYAKLLTGGTVPLSATLTTEDVFEAFQGKSKLDALLHGHSYTAHALGCASAVTSLKYFNDPLRNSNLLPNGQLQELWNPEMVCEVSSHPSVQRAVTLGTLFSCELQTGSSESGYASTSTKDVILRLRKDGIYTRPLGNVVYLMCGPLTPPQTCSTALETLYRHLG